MVKLTKTQIALGKKLHKLEGRATADLLGCTYPDIEPLIRKRDVTVESMDGIPIYVMTDVGLAWIVGLK